MTEKRQILVKVISKPAPITEELNKPIPVFRHSPVVKPGLQPDERHSDKGTPMQIPCPFIYANGRQCLGHISRIEAYHATVGWTQQPGGEWAFDWEERSHYHLFCSLKGGHAGIDRPDDPRMTFYGDQLPEDIGKILQRTDVKDVP